MRNQKSIDIAMLSNIIFEPYLQPLLKEKFGNDTKVLSVPYGEHQEPLYRSALTKSEIVIIWLDFNILFPDCITMMLSGKLRTPDFINDAFGLCRKLYDELSYSIHSKILWFGFEDYYTRLHYANGSTISCMGVVDVINSRLVHYFSNIIFVDTKRLIAETGIRNTYNDISKYRWNSPYSKTFLETVVLEINKQYLIKKGITKKCIIVDCDNVLWGGIVSEDGIRNIKLDSNGLGHRYQDFQRYLLYLHYCGVIIALCSKNDLSDVMAVFLEHSGMILKEQHIACFQINWRNKPENIRDISEKLNIGLESIVFVDDSPVEIEAVKSMIPEITTILFEKNMEYDQFSCFNLKSEGVVGDIEKRMETYKTDDLRSELKLKYKKYDDYIDALEIRIDIHEAKPIEFGRISELTQRTNKCTNGVRYMLSEVEEHISTGMIKLYSVTVSDCFSNLGIVGALEVDDDTLSHFSLSCRALGRKVEHSMISYIMERHLIKKCRFIFTGKNDSLKEFLIQKIPELMFTR